MSNDTFTYRLDLDRDYFFDNSMRYQSMLPFLTLITIRPLIFLILKKKRDYMTDIYYGYIINQIAMMAQEFSYCYLFRIHDIAPYSGLYCDGPICRMGIDKQYLMLLLAIATVCTLPTFLFLLLRMHQRIIMSTDSQLRLSSMSQFGIVLFMTVVLFLNVAGFYACGRDFPHSEQLAKVPDLAWLKQRGGTLFLFGQPGHPGLFRNELFILLFSMLTIAPFVAITTVHSLIVMHSQKINQTLTSRTQRIQARITRVFFVQLIVVVICFILPLSLMMLHMAVDLSLLFPSWLICLFRCLLIIPFTLKCTLLSLIFLLKNPRHRQIIKSAFRCGSDMTHQTSFVDRKSTHQTFQMNSIPKS